jgi:threonine dehydrogenase-like Zn-dependent dehydrogenase
MRALVFHGPWSLTVEERPEPARMPGEVLLEVIATGICGSDLHGFTGSTDRRQPGQVMGHETVGRVIGADTPDLTGRLVTVNPVLGCGDCAHCHIGASQRCTGRRVIGVSPELSSAFAERMVVPATNVIPLPEGADGLGALVEPLAVGFHAAVRAQITPQDRVLVIGGGPIGQAVAVAARRLTAESIAVSERSAGRRRLVERLGFNTLDPETEDVPAAARTALGGWTSVVVDAVGADSSLEDAFAASSLGARVVLVGMERPRLNLQAYKVSTEERTLIGSFCYTMTEFQETAAWAAANSAALDKLVDATVGLDEAPEAFRRLATGEWVASKVLVRTGLASAEARS